jgi:hypothetical protein
VASESFDRVELINDARGSAFPMPGLGFDDFVAGTRPMPAIPEPSAYALMLGGLILIACARLRDRRRAVDERSAASEAPRRSP